MVDHVTLDDGMDRQNRPNTEGYEERIPMLIKNGKAFRRADGEYADICEMQLLGHTGTCLAEVKDTLGTFKGQCQGARTVSGSDGSQGQQQQHPGTTEKCMTISGHGAALRTFRVPKDPTHVYECPAAQQARHQAAAAAAAAAVTGTIGRGGGSSGPVGTSGAPRGQHYHELDPSMLHNCGLSPGDGVIFATSSDRHIRYLPDLMPEAAVENVTNTIKDQAR